MFTFLLFKIKGKEFTLFMYFTILYLFITITIFGFIKGFISYLIIFMFIKIYSMFKIKSNNIFDIYFGVPGSGKSTIATYFTLEYLKKGIKVYSNIDTPGVVLYDKKDLTIDNDDLHDCLLIIDEAGVDFDNRNFKTNFNPKQVKLFKYHRHRNIDILVFSQDYEDMDKKLRKLATRLFIIKKSIFPFFIVRKTIFKKIDIDRDSKQIIDSYSFGLLSNYYVYMPKTWKYFDSFTDH